MEVDHAKGEKSLLQKMKSHFSIRNHKDIAVTFAQRVPPEEAMSWILSETAPFVSMLNEIYSFLVDSKATILGNADQFSFRFDELNERITFPLDSFPKSLIRTLTDVKYEGYRFIRDSRGHLLVDTPNYWRDNVPTLSHLSYSPVLQQDVFDNLPIEYQLAIHKRVRILLYVLDHLYVRYDIPSNTEDWALSNFRILYISQVSLLNELLERARRPGADGGRVTEPAARELWKFFQEWQDYGEIVIGDNLSSLLDHAEKKLGPESIDLNELTDVAFPPQGLERNQTYSFIKAFDLCFRKTRRTVQTLIDVIDKVFLPFYRHRWRLFEVWAILWVRQTVMPSCRPHPYLIHRDDDISGWEWVIPGGDAKLPVAQWHEGESVVEIWYQQKTALSSANVRRFKQAHIEPDIRVKTGTFGKSCDIAILELKDRYKARGVTEKKIARMYATTNAKLVCVANYSEYSAKALHQKVARENVGPTQILLVDEFRPGTVPREVAEQFARTINGSFAVIDLVADVSASITLYSLQRSLDFIGTLGITISRQFSFDTRLKEQANLEITKWSPIGGGTDLVSSLKEYLDIAQQRQRAKLLVVTDNDGLGQMEHAKSLPRLTELNVYCVNIHQDIDLEALKRWAFGF